eukprot:Gregarina_sp_Poly_1__6068@NODE_31_length_19375_cov_31_776984_g28_i0_p5_GENE_NODE_31_length_19375_cov_31_776984_g28_i0NODE_31_length_19375_cov_31_776984_g28_i0_p5_ORF_typecomplete_len181_score16_88DUF4667/PF15700_5/0_019_NODE_31_length_19375_cov_31_776984_g28_i01428714829
MAQLRLAGHNANIFREILLQYSNSLKYSTLIRRAIFMSVRMTVLWKHTESTLRLNLSRGTAIFHRLQCNNNMYTLQRTSHSKGIISCLRKLRLSSLHNSLRTRSATQPHTLRPLHPWFFSSNDSRRSSSSSNDSRRSSSSSKSSLPKSIGAESHISTEEERHCRSLRESAQIGNLVFRLN